MSLRLMRHTTDLLHAVFLEVKQLSLKSKVWAGTAAGASNSIKGTAVIQVRNRHHVRHDDCTTARHSS